jgi:hypothetical protein
MASPAICQAQFTVFKATGKKIHREKRSNRGILSAPPGILPGSLEIYCAPLKIYPEPLEICPGPSGIYSASLEIHPVPLKICTGPFGNYSAPLEIDWESPGIYPGAPGIYPAPLLKVPVAVPEEFHSKISFENIWAIIQNR